MSEILEKAARLITERLNGAALPHRLCLEVTGEGALFIGPEGVSFAAESPPEVTIRGAAETFAALLKGETSAPAAFMKGKLTVDGDFVTAMKLSGYLSR